MPNEYEPIGLVSDEDLVQHDELLFRGITMLHWKESESRVTSQFMYDRNGTSVDLALDRSETECVEKILSRNDINFLGVARLTTQQISEFNVCAFKNPVEGNQYHALVLNSDRTANISKKTRSKLARAITWHPK